MDEFFAVAFRWPVVRRALGFALVVGAVLVGINYGDALLGQRALGAAVASAAALSVDIPISTQSTLGPRLAHRYRYRSLRNRHVAKRAFERGEHVVLAPALPAVGLDVEAARAALAADPRAELVARSGGLEIYRWNAAGPPQR